MYDPWLDLTQDKADTNLLLSKYYCRSTTFDLLGCQECSCIIANSYCVYDTQHMYEMLEV